MTREPQASFTTGAFAALCGVSKHTLFHYDAVGVFSPGVKGENGYRYYGAAQIEVFHVISALKELDMPLADIKAYLDRRSPRELAALLEQKERALTRKLAELRRTRDLLRRKLALTREAMAVTPGEFFFREEAAATLICTEAPYFFDDESTALAVAEHVAYLNAHDIWSPYPIGAMLDPAAVGAGEGEGWYSHLYTRVDRPGRGVNVFEKPAGRYLNFCHDKGYDDLPAVYHTVLDYAARAGLSLRGPFYEDVLLDELSVRGYQRYMLQISILIS